MVYKPLLSVCLKQVLETFLGTHSIVCHWLVPAVSSLCLVSGVVKHFDNFCFFCGLKDNIRVNTNEMSQLSSLQKNVKKGAAIALDGYVVPVEFV